MHCARRYGSHVEIATTIMQAKSESGVVFCLQLLSKILTCTLPLELMRINISLVY